MEYDVKDLKAMGYKVKVNHLRHGWNKQFNFITNISFDTDLKEWIKNGKDGGYDHNRHFYPFGGITLVEITTPDGTAISKSAKCSMKDHYNKKIGRHIAIGRALKELQVQ